MLFGLKNRPTSDRRVFPVCPTLGASSVGSLHTGKSIKGGAPTLPKSSWVSSSLPLSRLIHSRADTSFEFYRVHREMMYTREPSSTPFVGHASGYQNRQGEGTIIGLLE